MPQPTYDYVIVGAGSAGCTLASRLTEDPDVKVLLLEAGGWDRHPLVRLPLGWGKVLLNRMYDWGYDTEPEPTLSDRRVEVTRGKVIGGSSTINAMAYVRGNRADYDRWASYGLAGWSYSDVLPYFRKQESWEGGANQYRGADGPLTTRKSRYQDPLVDAYLETARARGYAFNADYNGAEQDGFARMQMTIRRGWRDSASSAYLRPALSRQNLTVAVRSHCTRIVLRNARATGIEFVKDGQRHAVAAEREVILSAGTINSPQILMLSGIGPADALKSHGIRTEIDLPGVGQNLQDHAAALLVYGRKDASPLLRNMRIDRLAIGLAAGFMLGTGFTTDLPGGITAFVKSSAEEAIPNIQLLFVSGSLAAAPYLRPFKRAFADSFACRVVLLRPESRGTVTLASTNPLDHPRIRQGLLATSNDWGKLRDGIKIFRDLARSQTLVPFVAREVAPGANVRNDQQLEAYTRQSVVTAHHPAGTCRMGLSTDPAAVVDSKLRVLGVEGLRVIDASVFPDLVGGNINAPVVMIAEKAADFIAGKTQLK